ncbi:precorrin-3B synthase [Klenkia taihuensis]|uniref:Precorrin-3B synthase n=1 Tax=Klenkia taihuensis TaxID=1225127 RepID=A0A1I1NAL4_9ACTN|nr:precorrin-3B synthase [Klenkia taihuensis]GHE12098.1 precorrin-3B synthase [Klenkia taihuensis]SFC94774.1 precorrin-3B synthase [Klenkia taihuensis]
MTPRDRADACPGAVQTHLAADGRLARVRVPGGLLTGAQLLVLAQAAVDLADGALELTSRGNVQLRGLADDAPPELARRLHDAGLLPSEAHETARNVVASVLSGRSGGLVDVRPVVQALDAGLVADPSLAALPGRFLVTVDDGRGDVHGLAGDAGLVAVAPDALALVLAGHGSGLRAAPAQAHDLLLRAARAFLDERAAQGSQAWRVHELDDGPARVAARLGSSVVPLAVPAADPPVGSLEQGDGRVALVGLVPLGRLTTAALDVLVQVTAALGSEVQLTPWRSVAVPDLPDEYVDDVATALHSAGLVFDAASPWAQVTACAGLPGCAKSRADVRADAARAVATGTLPVPGPQHWAGCERRCGRPAGSVDVLATGQGYEIGAG